MDNIDEPCSSKIQKDNATVQTESSLSLDAIDESSLSDWELARKGIKLLINDKPEEAKRIFLSNPNNLTLSAGKAFIVFLEAITTFEDQKLTDAFETLREMEHRCNEILANENVLKNIKKSQVSNSEFITVSKVLESQIILADSLACIAALMFFQQDFTGLFKGGWLMRKSWRTYSSAYEMILKLYKNTVSQMAGDEWNYKEVEESSTVSRFFSSTETIPPSRLPPIPPGYDPSSLIDKVPHSLSFDSNIHDKCPYNKNTNDDDNSHADELHSDKGKKVRNSNSFGHKINGIKNMKRSATTYSNLSQSHFSSLSSKLLSPLTFFTSNLSYIASIFGVDTSVTDIVDVMEIQTITRLLSAVSFGFGFFHLAASLLPPSLQRVTSIFGINGDSDKGMELLMFSCKGKDMRSPLATLAILWYNVIVKPYFALDVSQTRDGLHVSKKLLTESEKEFKNSSVFLYYKGKVQILKSEVRAAVESFCQCSKNAYQEEIRMLAYHELGWTHMLALEFSEAQVIFHFLHLKSRWAMLLYLYLETINKGASGVVFTEDDMISFRSKFENPPADNQMETLLIRRFKNLPKRFTDIGIKTSLYWKSLVYELLYLWNSLPNCTNEVLRNIMQDCDLLEDDEVNKSMVGLDKLVSGFCYKIKGDNEIAMTKFREGLTQRKDIAKTVDDAHISAFLNYELGVILIKNANTKIEGKKFLLQTKTMKHYDFEHRIVTRVNILLKKL